VTDPIDFGKEKAKRAKKSDKLKKPELFQQIVLKMNRHRLAPRDWPEFPRRFHFNADRSGRKTILEELAEQIVVYRDRDLVADAILQYCWELIPHIPGATDVDYQGASKCRDMWLGLTPALREQPRVLSEKSHVGLTFKRLPFDAPAVPPSIPPPHFEALLARFSKPMAVCAYIGSLFYPDADRQQYLYLYGDGGDSKGTLMRFLHNIFGDAAQALSIPGQNGDKFWNFALYGRRLGLFYDTDASDWFRKAHFKSLTGGDPQWFEEKGRMGFTATPTVKFIVSSNFKPRVSGSAADMRRLIYVECQQVPEDQRQTNFENTLLEEAPAIISTCKAVYLEMCPKGAAIPCEGDTEIAREAEAHYIDVFHEHFELGNCELPAATVRSLLRKSGFSDNDISTVKSVWKRIFGVEVVRHNAANFYSGMGLKRHMGVGNCDEPC
jgi:hypothetical protein